MVVHIYPDNEDEGYYGLHESISTALMAIEKYQPEKYAVLKRDSVLFRLRPMKIQDMYVFTIYNSEGNELIQGTAKIKSDQLKTLPELVNRALEQEGFHVIRTKGIN